MNESYYQSLAKGKRKLFVLGLTSLYKLSNGWYAKRRAPENGWRGEVYWNLYRSQIDMEGNKPFAGSPGTLAAALRVAAGVESDDFRT